MLDKCVTFILVPQVADKSTCTCIFFITCLVGQLVDICLAYKEEEIG